MRIIEPSITIINAPDYDQMVKHIERAGRVCYKSEDKIGKVSSHQFVAGIITRGHEAVIEHASITVQVVCDRGVSHEIVRHRLASYCQESTRYCNYAGDKFRNEITVIRPNYLMTCDRIQALKVWMTACAEAETAYFKMLDAGCSPQEARAVLPNSLKTEVIMTMNLREWRHFLTLRTSKAAHPQMRQVAKMILAEFKAKYPVFFSDIGEDNG